MSAPWGSWSRAGPWLFIPALLSCGCELLAGIDDRKVEQGADPTGGAIGGGGSSASVGGGGTAGDGGSGGAPACSPGGSICQGNTARTCTEAGVWSDSPCGAEVCSHGACTKITSIALGHDHGCASLSDGRVRCWGANEFLELGTDSVLGNSETPIEVPGLENVERLARGADHTCALLLDGTVTCWGRNHRGQLGQGIVSTAALPAPVQGLPAGVSFGGRATGQHSCAIVGDRLYCWGCNNVGQLGTGVVGSAPQDPWGCVGPPSDHVPQAQLVPDGPGGLPTPVTDVAAGCLHTCAVADGNVYCWGRGGNELGIGVTEGPPVPEPTLVDLSALSLDPNVSISQISAGCTSTCARFSDGRVSCWGANGTGFLGNGTFADASTPSSFVSGVASAVDARAGAHVHCVRESEGLVSCWGYSEYGGVAGQEPCGCTSDSHAEPKPVVGLDVSLLETGWHHACALAQSGLRCWGLNDHGQLGDGTFQNAWQPQPVAWSN